MNKTAVLAFCGLVLLVAVYAQFPIERRINNALLPQGFVAWRWAQGLGRPRQITRLPNSSDLLVVETSPNRRITLLHDDNNDGINDASERIILVDGNSTSLPQTNLGLNHAIVYRAGYIYASTDTTVYRWAFTPGSRSPITTAPEILITGIPAGGRHSTRTLNFDAAGRLYVQLGSQTDIDSDTRRSSIHSFNASYFDGTTPLTAPLDFTANGFLYAYGLRNHVAFRFDSLNRPLGVENGIDAISRSDLGGIITATNPGEELNLLPDPLSTDPNLARFYGYPYCWSEFDLNITSGPQIAHQPGTQWADSNFMNDGVHTDSWCRSAQNNVAPVSVYDPHSATLDINFYNPIARSSGSYFGASQQQYSGVAFTTQHGAHLYLRDPATGYQVVTTRYTGSTQTDFAIQEKSSFFRAQGPGLFPDNWWRPTSLVFGECPNAGGDCLYVTADANGTVLAMGYYPERYVNNQEIPEEDTDPNPCATPSPCPSVSPCASCPSASPAPGNCGGCGNNNGGGDTNVNFYFADMLRGV